LQVVCIVYTFTQRLSMRKYHIVAFLSLLSLLLIAPSSGYSQNKYDTSRYEFSQIPTRKLYRSAGFDGAIFSTADMKKTGEKEKLTTLRFTLFFNIGHNFNYDLNDHFGIFTGVNIKNIGYIEKVGDSTIKRRVYTIGIPIGVKFGNLSHRNFVFAGTGLDMPFNYKEKGYVTRGNKDKYNEWFSSRTATFMPYFFVGVSVTPGVIFKLQYYPVNFLNTDYTSTANGISYKPYSMYESLKLIALSVGWDIHYRTKNLPRNNAPKTNLALRY